MSVALDNEIVEILDRLLVDSIISKKNTKRFTIIVSSSIYSDMGEMALALDSVAAAGGSSSGFTIELHPPLPLNKGVDYKLALISSDI